MKKVLLSFMLVFSLSVLFAISVKASVTTSEYRNIVDMSSGSSYLLLDVDGSKPTLVVFIEDTCDLFFLRNDGSAGKFYFLPAKTSNVGNDVEFYDSSLNGSCSSSSVLWYYGGQRSVNLPYGIYCPSTMNVLGNFKAVYPDVKYATINDFVSALSDAGSYENYLKNISSSKDENKLPMLHYKLSSKNVISFPNIIDKKISIDWDFSNTEPYASDPMSYALEIIISANFYPNSEGLKNCWDASNSSINESCKRVLSAERPLLEKPYSFIYLKEGDALYTSTNHIFATDELQDGYYLYIRSFSKDGTKSSNYKVYKCTTGGTSGQMDLTYDTEGNEHPLDEEDRDEASDYSNEYDENSSSSADEDPTGDSYDGSGGYSFDTLYGNLTSMVNMLQGVPELWLNVMSWLPSWFPTFIVTMMGLLIVIGVLKYIF